MKRGRFLEKDVIKIIEKKINKKLMKCDFIIIPDFPIFGASPDAIRDEFVLEVKCPSTEKSFGQYIFQEDIITKYRAIDSFPNVYRKNQNRFVLRRSKLRKK